MFKTDFAEDICHRISDCRCRCQRKIHYSERYIKGLGCFSCNKLTYSGNLESCLLDSLAESFKICSAYGFKCVLDNTGAAYADIDNTISFGNTVECSGHKRIVVGSVTEYYKLHTACTVVVLGKFGCFFDYFTHEAYGVHVDAGLGGTYINGGTYASGFFECFGNGTNKKFFRRSHTLGNKSAESAEKVNAHVCSGLVKSLGHLNIVINALTCRSTDE